MELRKRRIQLLLAGIITVSCILATGLSPAIAQPNSWTTKANMSEAKREIMSSEVNGKIYVFGGYFPDHRKNTVEEYDPVTNTWTTKTPMPSAREAGISAVVNGKVYVIGGYNAPNRLNVVEEYDPATNTWTNCGTPAPGNACAPMPTARNRVAGAVVNGKIYAIGGETNMSDFTIVEEYDPVTNTWTTKTPLPTPRTQHTSSVVNDKIYVTGGGGSAHNTVEEYDPATDTWTNCGTPAPGNACALMPTGRTAMTSSSVNGKIYVIGGVISGASYYLDTVEEYDPVTNTWTNCGVPAPGNACTPMPTARWFMASSVANGRIYVSGGAAYDIIHLPTVEEYTPPMAGDVTIEKTQSASDTVIPGESFFYTLTIRNSYQGAVDMLISDTVSEYVTSGLFEVYKDGELFEQGDLLGEDLSYHTGMNGVAELILSFQVAVKEVVAAGSLILNQAFVKVFPGGTDFEIDSAASNSVQTEVVPEPGTVFLFGIGLFGMLALMRITRKLRK